MKVREFYRVEDPSGYGMYSSPLDPMVSSEMNGDPQRHPKWQDDSRLSDEVCREFGVGYNPKDWEVEELWRWGFCSMEQLKFWIYRDEWQEELTNCGFRVAHLRAEGLHGDTQGIFDPTTREDITSYSLMEI